MSKPVASKGGHRHWRIQDFPLGEALSCWGGAPTSDIDTFRQK